MCSRKRDEPFELVPRVRYVRAKLLLCRARRIIYHKGRLERRVLRAQEVNSDGLTAEGRDIKTLENVPGCLVQVRVRRKCRQHRIAGVANLHLQPVELGRCRSFSSIDLQPETQRRAVHARRDRDLLEQRIRMRCAVAVEPCVERTGPWRLAGGIGDHARGCGPVNRARFEAPVE